MFKVTVAPESCTVSEALFVIPESRLQLIVELLTVKIMKNNHKPLNNLFRYNPVLTL